VVSKKIISDLSSKISWKYRKLVKSKFFNCKKTRGDRKKRRTYLKSALKSEPEKVKFYKKRDYFDQ